MPHLKNEVGWSHLCYVETRDRRNQVCVRNQSFERIALSASFKCAGQPLNDIIGPNE